MEYIHAKKKAMKVTLRKYFTNHCARYCKIRETDYKSDTTGTLVIGHIGLTHVVDPVKLSHWKLDKNSTLIKIRPK